MSTCLTAVSVLFGLQQEDVTPNHLHQHYNSHLEAIYMTPFSVEFKDFSLCFHLLFKWKQCLELPESANF